MEYSQPTLFGVAYASRLFREADDPSSYEHLVRQTAPKLDLGNDCHTSELLKWLNKWNCRIAKHSFGKLSQKLGTWFAREGQELPSGDTDIAGLEVFDLNQLAHAYEALRKCELGPTAAGKVLFAVRPRCAIPWDEPIRTKFELGDDGDGYRKMLLRSREEVEFLGEDAKAVAGYDIADIPNAVGSAATLARLLDEYNSITITVGHTIPSTGELQRWISWHPRRQRVLAE